MVAYGGGNYHVKFTITLGTSEPHPLSIEKVYSYCFINTPIKQSGIYFNRVIELQFQLLVPKIFSEGSSYPWNPSLLYSLKYTIFP